MGPNENIRDLSGGDCEAQFDWLYDVCGCVMSPTLSFELDFINNYKKS